MANLITPRTPGAQRYIGLYHYSSYWDSWDKILGVTDYQWIVEDIDGKQRSHCTAIEGDKFADAPFKVRSTTKIKGD